MDTSIMYPLYAVVGLLGVTAVAVGLYAFARNEKRTALLDDTKDQTKELLKRRGDVVDLVAIFERKGLTWRDAMDTLRFEFRGGLEGEEKEHASRWIDQLSAWTYADLPADIAHCFRMIGAALHSADEHRALSTLVHAMRDAREGDARTKRRDKATAWVFAIVGIIVSLLQWVFPKFWTD